jgi:8-amino-7-oxononanoate synthase
MKNPVSFRISTQPSFQAALSRREQDEQLRRLRSSCPVGPVEITLDNKRLVNFASNDYLGLSQNPFLKERAIEYVQKYGVGAPASRLLSGNLDCYEQIEQKIARLKGKEAALLFATGFQANVTALTALTGRYSVIAADRLNHRSLLEGMQLSGARWFRYKHNNFSDISERFGRNDAWHDASRWIVTESIFSMDGDCADLSLLSDRARQLGASVYVDEAHATGVCGPNGMGLSVGLPEIAVSMGTFGKGLGVFGAYIACSKVVREYLVNFCAGLIYSTALPPAVLGAIDASLDLVPSMSGERERLKRHGDYLRRQAALSGFDTGKSESQIVPLIVGSESRARELAAFLEEQGFFAPAIRPPTVAAGKARVRISLSAQHTESQLEALAGSLRGWHERKT